MDYRKGMDAVRWAAVCAVTAALLLFAAGAYGSAFFKGPVNGGANNAGVEFRAKIHRGHARKVLEFRWFNIPVPPNCADSFEGLKFNMAVNRRGKFSGRYEVPNTNHVANVKGHFKHHAKKAVGTIRLRGSFAGGCVNADTGLLNWTAKRPGG
jgi:hypothetical protein